MTESNVIDLNSLRKRQPRPTTSNISIQGEFSFTKEVEKDIGNLMTATGLERQQAIGLAKDFYRTYPMLVEFVRSPNELLKK